MAVKKLKMLILPLSLGEDMYTLLSISKSPEFYQAISHTELGTEFLSKVDDVLSQYGKHAIKFIEGYNDVTKRKKTKAIRSKRTRLTSINS